MMFSAYRMKDGNGGTTDSTAISEALVTGTTNPRLRVDQANTGFWEGRQFRSFKELSIASGQSLYVKFTVPVNTIVLELSTTIDNGSLRQSNLTNVTPTGTYSDVWPVIAQNHMTGTPVYAPQCSLSAGGSVSASTVVDVMRLVSGGNNAPSISAAQGDERGLDPGTYYIKLENLGAQTVTGVLHISWEEVPGNPLLY